MRQEVDLDQAADFAKALAREAGCLVMGYFRNEFEVRHKGAVDLVTEADLASEKLITAAISERYPDHQIIAEESHSGEIDPTSHAQWVVDPIDGTTNFVHGLPLFCISIGLRMNGETVLGAVYNPASDEMFAATRGGGATLNGEPISVSQTKDLDQALFVTGFAYKHDDLFHATFALWHEMYNRTRAGRRLGAAALDCCYVAAGRFDIFYETTLKPWDFCAGDLIVREAGGTSSDWHGEPIPYDGRRTLFTNGRLHQKVLDVMAEDEFMGMR